VLRIGSEAADRALRAALPTFIRPCAISRRKVFHMNIPRSIRLSGLALSLLFIGCADENKESDAGATPADTTAAVLPSFDPMQVQAPPSGTAVTDPNPAHGEPGHRCEIPVGASLASAPPPGAPDAVPTTSPMINAPPIQTLPSAAPTATAPGMNPPHGQPGHDCAVAVGSPLPK